MARGRSKFGNHNKPTAKMKAAQKKRDREVNALVSNVFAATAAASHEVARQSKKSVKRGGTSRAVSPEYAVAVRLAQMEAEEEARQRSAELEAEREERRAQKAAKREAKEAERAERLAKNPPKPPKSPVIYRVMGGTFVALGLVLLPLFWPLGIAAAAFGVWWIVSARKVYSDMTEKYRAVHPEFGAGNETGK